MDDHTIITMDNHRCRREALTFEYNVGHVASSSVVVLQREAASYIATDLWVGKLSLMPAASHYGGNLH